MGQVLGQRRTVTQKIREIEKRIEEKEKAIRDMKSRRASVCSFFVKGIVLSSALCGGFIWVVKETVALRTTLSALFVALTGNAAACFLAWIAHRWYLYRIFKETQQLDTLRDIQSKNIESLKRETKYDETASIIARYQRNSSGLSSTLNSGSGGGSRAGQSSRGAAEEEAPSVVEKIVENLL